MNRVEQNPFYILDLRPGASRAQIEHQGQKLLQMLELGSFEDVTRYHTPLGAFARTPDLVRQAMHQLRDPARRAEHEFWATLPAAALDAPVLPTHAWPDAREQFGW